MKKGFLFLASLMLLMTGCSQLEPTEVDINQSPDKVSVVGYLRYQSIDKKGALNDIQVVPNDSVVIFYGVKDGGGNMSYIRYTAATDRTGHFSMELGVKPGQVIDEVKVQGSAYAPVVGGTLTASYGVVDSKLVEADTEYFAEVSKTNLQAGNTYYYDVVMQVTAYPNDPEIKQPK